MSNYALKLTNITKKYDDFLLDRVSFNVPKGNIVGLIGENGAGKSTTLNSLSRINTSPESLSIISRIELSVVLFPAPFSPINPTIFPFGTLNETLSKRKSSYFFVMFVNFKA